MRLQEEVFEVYKNHILAHPEENQAGALKAREIMENSPLNRNGVMEKSVHIPKVYDEDAIADFRRIADTAKKIFAKVISEYREHEDFRRLFPFSRELEELILLPAPYEGSLPIARFDLFYQEDSGKFYFCEINTDGTAAMFRDLEMRKALVCNPAHREAEKRFVLEPFELFDSWVQTFMALYDTYPKKKKTPHVAIVDILENGTSADFDEFLIRFENAGISCEICDIRELVYRDHALYSPAGKRIDAVYRRAVTADIMDHYEEVTDFLNAVREDAVFFAGAFATQIIHTKWLFYVLHLDRTKSFLTEEERAFVEEHVPLTVEFSADYIPLERVQQDRASYIIKPMDAYASKGVYAAGHEYSQEDWVKVTEDLYGKGYICQQYCPQYMTENIDYAWGDGKWHPYMNMPGLYVYNGVFRGFLMRMACEEKIIVAHENERTVPVFTVKGRR